jgi:hypothetical protein
MPAFLISGEEAVKRTGRSTARHLQEGSPQELKGFLLLLLLVVLALGLLQALLFVAFHRSASAKSAAYSFQVERLGELDLTGQEAG